MKTVEPESWTPETGPRFSEQTGAQPETGQEVSHLGIGMLQYDRTQSIGRLSFPCAIAGDGGRGSPPLLPPHALGKQEPGSSHFGKGPFYRVRAAVEWGAACGGQNVLMGLMLSC